MEILEELGPNDRERVEHLIETKIEKSIKDEREAIIDFLRSRVGFWNSNSNVNKKIERLANDVENCVHHRIQQDNQNHES